MATSTFFLRENKMGRGTKLARHTLLMNRSKFWGDFFVKTTADVRQVAAWFKVKRPRERPNKMGLLEVNFVDQEMNFRIVKKTIRIYGKIENNEWWGQKVNFGEKKRTVRGQDFPRRCIIYSKYCRTGPTLSQLRVFFIGNSLLSLADLTLPLVNPPTSQGQPNYFLPSSPKDGPRRNRNVPDEGCSRRMHEK